MGRVLEGGRGGTEVTSTGQATVAPGSTARARWRGSSSRIVVLLGALVLVSGIPAGTTAADSAPASGDVPADGARARGGVDLDDVLERYFAATGGREALMAIETLRIDAVYEEPAYDLVTPTRIYKRRPDDRVVELPEIGIAEGYLDAAWELHLGSDPELIRTDGAAEAATRRGAEFDESFVNWRAKGHQAELVGTTEIRGRELLEVSVVLRDGWEKTYYFDPDTGLLVARRKAMPIHARGEDVETLTFLEDYREVAGVLMPFVETEYRVDDGEMLNRLTWTDVAVNEPMEDELFTPEATRERMGAER